MTVRMPIRPTVRRYNDRESSTQLREENSRLKTDISRLRIEKAQLRDENLRLRKENSQLKEELYFIHEELDEERDRSEVKDIELAKNNTLYHMLEEEHLRLHFD